MIKYRFYFAFNSALLLWYFLIFFNLDSPISFDVMFSTPDAQTYLSVADWISNQKETIQLEFRPFLFPFFLMIVKSIGGAFSIWFAQFLMWIGTINLVYLSVQFITKKRRWAILTSAFCAINLSLISLTLHALTEVTTAFLLALLLYNFVKRFEFRRELRFILPQIAILSALVAIKPTFSIPLLLVCIVILAFLLLKKVCI